MMCDDMYISWSTYRYLWRFVPCLNNGIMESVQYEYLII